MEKHDYRGAHAAMEALFNGHTVKSSGEYRDATLAALRAAVSRQEAEEAMKRGEAVMVVGEVRETHVPPYFFVRDHDPRDSGRPVAIFSVVVPIPRPVEIEADVES